MRTLLAGLIASLSMSAAADDSQFCAWAQGVIAETALVPEVNLHHDWDSFVDAKPTDQPFVIDQYFSSFLTGQDGVITTVSCKMRTAERINTVHSEEDGSDTPPAGIESQRDTEALYDPRLTGGRKVGFHRYYGVPR